MTDQNNVLPIIDFIKKKKIEENKKIEHDYEEKAFQESVKKHDEEFDLLVDNYYKELTKILDEAETSGNFTVLAEFDVFPELSLATNNGKIIEKENNIEEKNNLEKLIDNLIEEQKNNKKENAKIIPFKLK